MPDSNYDGNDRRVKKYVPSTGETTIFVFDGVGKQIAEYSTVAEAAQDAKVAYLTNDHLGSPRINTDRDGNVTARHDYHPFGEEILTAQRTQGLGYDADTVRKQFTGYERDGESDLDFAQARMYARKLGRFMAADPLLGSGRVEIAQSWNRYSYVRNNPLSWIDPTGLYDCVASTEQCQQIADSLQAARNLLGTLNKKSKEYKRISRALATYGCDSADKRCGEKGKNGLTIRVGTLDEGRSAEAGTSGGQEAKTTANPTGRIAEVTFTEDTLNGIGGVDLSSVIVHEGSHLADGEDWVGSNFSEAKNPSFYKAETDAYTTTGMYQQAQRPKHNGDAYQEMKRGKPVFYYIWNKSWKNIDSSRAIHVKNIVRVTAGYTPDQDGGKTLDRDAKAFR